MKCRASIAFIVFGMSGMSGILVRGSRATDHNEFDEMVESSKFTTFAIRGSFS